MVRSLTVPRAEHRRRAPAPWPLAIALAIGLAAAALLAMSPVVADPALGPLQLARRINLSPVCTRSEVLGLCWCGATPCGYRVRMYVPVAFVETVRAPADSLLGLSLLGLPLAGVDAVDANGTQSSSHSGLDNTAEAHAWLVADSAWLLSGPIPCLSCKPSDARSDAPPPSTVASPTCGPTGAVIEALASNPLSALAPLLGTLAYSSEADALNWRTGCRDLLTIDSWAQAPSDLRSWGPLRPRQMRDLGTPPVLYSAKTSYRALSIARDQLGTFPFPVDLAAHMQQAYPAISTCFDVGEQPLPQAPVSLQPVQTSADGRYGWFYWRPVTCCIGLQSLTMCPKPR